MDHCLLEAVRKSCAHFLVSEDRGIHSKAKRLGVANVVFTYAAANDFEWIYLTAFEDKQPFLIDFLEDLGFERLGMQTGLGEVILAKPVGIRQGLPAWSDPARMLRRYGPFSFLRDSVGAFVVPIQPQFRQRIINDHGPDVAAAPGDEHGRKEIAKDLVQGPDVMAFTYASQHGSWQRHPDCHDGPGAPRTSRSG